jgi:acetyltransferase-like isoleucine patch superfamily enzyme
MVTNIRIRNRVTKLGKGAAINRTVQFHPGVAPILIGDDCFIAQGCIFSIRKSGLHIGDGVMIGPRCMFFDWSHTIDPASIDLRKASKQLISKGAIKVHDGVWIGAGVIVLHGVEIGRGAVIGAGAVVAQSVPAYAVAVGNPARVVRYRVAD